MRKRGFSGNPAVRLDKVRLVTLLGIVFVAITVLTAALVYYAHSQLKWQAFHQYRGLATTVSNSIEARLSEAVDAELRRPVTQYRFYDSSRGPEHRSELAQLNYRGEFAANIGYFQVDGNGQFTSPLLPPVAGSVTTAGLSAAEWSQRKSIANDVVNILGNSDLVDTRSEDRASASAPSPVQAEQRQAPVTGSTVAELNFDAELSKKSESYELRQRRSALAGSEIASHLERSIDADRRYEMEAELVLQQLALEESAEEEFPRVTTFSSAPAPFELSVLGVDHFALFRRVMLDNEALVQGMVLRQQSFLDVEVGRQFELSALSEWGHLAVVLDQAVVAEYAGQELTGNGTEGSVPVERGNVTEASGDLLYQHQLAAPFGSLQLVFSLAKLPAGPAGGVLLWVSIALVSVLCGGFYILYRAGLKQIELSQQQQNFVASVTHELKTPLTSIRMYGEMLQSGWVSDDKRQDYYQYIHDESQRLSRLIANVLQMANISNESILPELETVSAVELMAGIKSTLQTHLQRCEASVDYSLDTGSEALQVRLDRDAWAQVVINLVDNAIKFSSRPEENQAGENQADRCRLSISIAQNDAGEVFVDFRDYGPGIPDGQRKKIFELFYRPENELVRQTVGTGIGLAIVRQLLNQMHAGIDAANASPGARFRVTFPLAP